MFDFAPFLFLVGYLQQVVMPQLATSGLKKWTKHASGWKHQLKKRLINSFVQMEHYTRGCVMIGEEQYEIDDEYIDMECECPVSVEFLYFPKFDLTTYEITSLRGYNSNTSYCFDVKNNKVVGFHTEHWVEDDDYGYSTARGMCTKYDDRPYLHVKKLIIASPFGFQVFDVYFNTWDSKYAICGNLGHNTKSARF